MESIETTCSKITTRVSKPTTFALSTPYAASLHLKIEKQTVIFVVRFPSLINTRRAMAALALFYACYFCRLSRSNEWRQDRDRCRRSYVRHWIFFFIRTTIIRSRYEPILVEYSNCRIPRVESNSSRNKFCGRSLNAKSQDMQVMNVQMCSNYSEVHFKIHQFCNCPPHSNLCRLYEEILLMEPEVWVCVCVKSCFSLNLASLYALFYVVNLP